MKVRSARAAMSAAMVLAVVLTACGGDGDTSEASESDTTSDQPTASESETATEQDDASGELDTLSIVHIPTADHPAHYLGMQEGIFEKHGLELDITLVTSASALTAALTSGEADLASHSISAFSAIDEGLSLRVISGVTYMPDEGYMETVVPVDSKIQTFSDLQGLDVGIVAAQGVFELATRAAIAAEDGDPMDMEGVAIPPGEDVPAVESGRLDAASVGDPFLTTSALQSDKLRSIGAPASALGYSVPAAMMFVTDETLQEKEGVLERYRQALAEATDRLNEDVSQRIELIQTYTELPPEVLEAMHPMVYETDMDRESVERTMQQMKDYGWLSEDLTADDVIWEPTFG